jgi:hypothetical protein
MLANSRESDTAVWMKQTFLEYLSFKEVLQWLCRDTTLAVQNRKSIL